MTKRTNRALGLVLGVAPLFVVGCSSSSATVTPPDTGCGDACVDADTGPDADAADVADAPPETSTCGETTPFTGGDVTADRTLTTACSPYTITRNINVNGNATLTIQPGVVLRFAPDTLLSIGYSGAAKLVATGTAASPITFTSSSASPGAGDWAGVQLWSNTMSGTSLGYVKLDYCGSKGDACVVGTGVKSGRVTIDHAIIAHVGAGSDGILEKDVDSSFAIASCTFSDIPSTPTQQYAISLYAPSFAGIDSTNAFNGSPVQLMGGTIASNTTWRNIGTPVMVSADVKIGGAAKPTLTLAAGSVFEFAADVGISLGYSAAGSLNIAGTATSNVVLTSAAGTPGAGDWNGIILWSNSSAKITYATISYAGSTTASSSYGAVSLVSNDDSLEIRNSTISHSAEYGVGIPCKSTATVVNVGNTFTSNALGDVGPGPSGVGCP
jgi:hypothetical protein